MSDRVKKKADTIFGLPNNIFGPLSSSVRRDYAQLLLYLYREHLGSGLAGSMDIRKSDMIGYLGAGLARIEPSEFCIDANNASINQDASAVYRNLHANGWFIERKIGTEITVVICRQVMELLRSLDKIESGSSINFTGSLQTIEVSLMSLQDDPRSKAMMLVTAAKQAEDFAHSMAAVSADIRSNEMMIASQTSFGDLMDAFFNDFVSHLISDYKVLKSRYNPLQHADSILSKATLFMNDDALKDELARGYVDFGFAADLKSAHVQIMNHLETLGRVFMDAKRIVDDIDETKLRVEERISRALRFNDASSDNDVEEISMLIADLGKTDDSLSDTVLLRSHLLVSDFPIDEGSMAKPRDVPTTVGPVSVKVQEHDPEMERLSRAIWEYAESMIPTAERIEEFIEANMGENVSIKFSEFDIQSPAHMLLFSNLRMIETHTDERLHERYGAVIDSNWNDGIWSEHINGFIYRKGSVADPEMKQEAYA